ncbi:MAG: class I tRNA ligase family protein, partial [Candidatus Caldarchaeum sp.]|nr:class I tRNA ligase family protein [Candidatus Caldarchaeum sp.]MDW8436350.1 class I tRNA ligase family protein [Candidatus Caldarchaeum sp.]
NGRYVVAQKDNVKLVMSYEAVQKLSEQMSDLRTVGEIDVRTLLGKHVQTPLTKELVPVLPADFVDVSLGTGVVYSVPAHAPYDYAALKELQKNPSKLVDKGLDPKLVQNISPKKVIKTTGLGDFPAVEAVERLGITSQMDERLEDVTRDIYSKEFYSGLMAVGEFEGRPVSEARALVIEKLKWTNSGDVFYDLSGKVVCRSGDECVVKIVEDQWFLNFSNPEWKAKVKEHLSRMNVFPEAAKTWFLNVVDWLRDWACTRKTGLGTPLPWDPSWKIETLSDSTIYPALYTISRTLNQNLETAKNLN